jgi:hypothetical protein
MKRLLGCVVTAALLSGLAGPVRAADDKEKDRIVGARDNKGASPSSVAKVWRGDVYLCFVQPASGPSQVLPAYHRADVPEGNVARREDESKRDVHRVSFGKSHLPVAGPPCTPCGGRPIEQGSNTS